MSDNATNIKATGLKATAPRLKILELFENSRGRHLCAEDIYREFVNEGFDIGLATIYRVLTQFEKAGILLRHNFELGKAVYELEQDGHHDHMVCLVCGKVVEFFDKSIEVLQSRVAKEHGYLIMDHSLCMYGKCPECLQKECSDKA